MSSALRAPSQRLTNTLVVSSGATASVFSLADLTTQLIAAGAAQIGSLFVAPNAAAIATAAGAATLLSSPAASATLTDLGKTITIEVSGATDGAVLLKLREVKYQTATSTFLVGYVVVENNYNGGVASANRLKVAVARV